MSRLRRIFCVGVGVVAAALALSPVAAEATERSRSIYQLRIYEIFDRNKAAFYTRFRDHAVRIMTRHGFDIVAMWEAQGQDGPEFIYLLRWHDEQDMTDRWAAFMADEEWTTIKERTAAEHGELVGRIESRIMRTTSYSRTIE